MGPGFVERTLKRWEKNQQELSKGRELLATHSKAVERMLRGLVVAELQASETMLAEDADEAVRELLNFLTEVGTTVKGIEKRISEFGSSGV